MILWMLGQSALLFRELLTYSLPRLLTHKLEIPNPLKPSRQLLRPQQVFQHGVCCFWGWPYISIKIGITEEIHAILAPNYSTSNEWSWLPILMIYEINLLSFTPIIPLAISLPSCYFAEGKMHLSFLLSMLLRDEPLQIVKLTWWVCSLLRLELDMELKWHGWNHWLGRPLRTTIFLFLLGCMGDALASVVCSWSWWLWMGDP